MAAKRRMYEGVDVPSVAWNGNLEYERQIGDWMCRQEVSAGHVRGVENGQLGSEE